MASSSSPITPYWKYDVFLSFRGADVRNSFTSHLYDALCRNKIDTYIDYKLGGGENIEPALLERIEQSYISVVIFSDNYADSTFCLNELSKILECKEKKGQMVLPVFYRVNPSHVQELSGSFGDALRKHKQECSSRKLKRWRHALKEIANLKGWDSNVTKPETKLIQEIVDDIQKKLEQMPLSADLSQTISKGFVGIMSRVHDIESLLSFESSNVLIVGIWGIGGIGKSTTAELVYHRNSQRFEGCCFSRNVREKSQKHGLVHVLQKILREVLQQKDLSISTKVLDFNIRRMLQRKKVLIVLDDVINPPDLKHLVGEEGLFGQGSRIIVTSRDRQVLINQCEEDKIYEVKDLDKHDALQLFSLHAFKQNYPEEEYVQLSKKVLRFIKGIPLVLEVLGCFLYKRSVDDWESKLVQLQKHSDMEIHRTLETCYHDLDETAKKIFLDIACFFGIESKDLVRQKLDPEERIGISRLTDLCLIKIIDNNIWMHDVLQHLGKEIVCREEVDDPGKRSRLWEFKDVGRVLTNSQGTNKVEAISFKCYTAEKNYNFSPAAFNGMSKLRLLRWYGPRVQFPNGLEFLPNELRILKWYFCPLKSFPSNFSPDKLVELEMENSELEQLWSKNLLLVNLKSMNLSGSTNLSLIDADLSKLPNLEYLNLRYLTSFELPSSIIYCTKLIELDLEWCRSLCTLPSSIGHLSQLVKLSLANCSRLVSLPDSIGDLKCLEKLNLSSCSSLTSLPNSIGKLKCLVELHLKGCWNLASLPNSIGHLKCLTILTLFNCSKLASLPNSIGQLKCLAEVYLSHCSNLASLPNSIYDLESLETLEAYYCRSLDGFPQEKQRSSETKEIPVNIKPLPKLTRLALKGCERVRYLPEELPSSLRNLDATSCSSLESVASLFKQGEEEYEAGSEDFRFGYCNKLGENSCMKFIGEARLRIQRMARASFNQGVDKVLKFRFFIPGMEIPEWFRYKNSYGSSLQYFELPAHWSRRSSNNHFLGFAFCTVVEFDSLCDDIDNIACDCLLITKGTSRVLRFSYVGDTENSLSMRVPDHGYQEHVYIWYDYDLKGSDCFFDEASFRFYTNCDSDECCPVLSCGVLPLFTQDE